MVGLLHYSDAEDDQNVGYHTGTTRTPCRSAFGGQAEDHESKHNLHNIENSIGFQASPLLKARMSLCQGDVEEKDV